MRCVTNLALSSPLKIPTDGLGFNVDPYDDTLPSDFAYHIHRIHVLDASTESISTATVLMGWSFYEQVVLTR